MSRLRPRFCSFGRGVPERAAAGSEGAAAVSEGEAVVAEGAAAAAEGAFRKGRRPLRKLSTEFCTVWINLS